MLGLSPTMLFEIAPRPARPRRLEYTIPLPLILPVRKDILTTMAMTISRLAQGPVTEVVKLWRTRHQVTMALRRAGAWNYFFAQY